MSAQAAKQNQSGGGGGGSPTKKTPLPPPPHVSTSTNHNALPTQGSIGVRAPSLPPPPSLVPPRPFSSGDGTNSNRLSSAAVPAVSKSTSGMPLPPPPIVSSSLPPPPSITTVLTSASATGDVRSKTEPTLFMHSTIEKIPPLSSSPNSGVFMFNGSTEDLQRHHQPHSNNSVSVPKQMAIHGGSSSSSSCQRNQNENADILTPALKQLQVQQSQSQQGAPSSGNSWTAWAGQLTTTAAPMAGTLLEKAGQLAYSTVGSAADLVASTGVSQVTDSNVRGYMPTPSLANNTRLANADPLPSFTFPIPESAVKDNFAHLFTGGSPTSQCSNADSEPSISSSYSMELNGKNNESNMARIIATPDSSVHAFPLPPPIGKCQPPIQLKQEQMSQSLPPPPHQKPQQHHQQQQQRRRRAAANPPSSVLANRQSRLSVLILPTAEAQSIATRNNTTLSEMFRVFGNLRSSSSGYVGGQIDSSLEPMLPSFRSANKSMSLSWENLMLEFVNHEDMDNKPTPESVMERGLEEATRLWDEDRIAINPYGASPSSSVNGDFGNKDEDDVEMDQLEGYVVNALSEDEVDERARRGDGIPSMSSTSSSSLRNSIPLVGKGEEVTSASNHHEQPFPPRPEEALESSADAAFALAVSPTSPWLLRFRHTLDCATDGLHHELLCNPSVVILVACTSEYSYVNCLAELANVHHLPRPYHDGRYDPNGLRREFLLLHDITNGPKDFDEARALSQMRDRFGYGCCSVLKINSLVPKPVPISDGYFSSDEDAVWENAGPSSPFFQNTLSNEYRSSLGMIERAPPIRGACLSPSDKRAIRRYVANMTATGLVPAVERRIAHLNTAVSNAKKGVKNVIKSFWRKPKENLLVTVSGNSENIGSGSGRINGGDGSQNSDLPSVNAKYRFDSIESQTRLLADTLFLMRDYEAALSAYRLVKDDYKLDKAHLHYASVHEMMVLCMYCLDTSGRDGRYFSDIHHSIETALYSYARASDEQRESDANSGARPAKAPYATRLATRFCLALSSARSLCEGKHMEVADLLASASSHETPLGAAILLEHSSAHYYRAGMLRKFAFHMLMAGHMFRSGGQDRHAFRCFAASLYVYHCERWEELRSHLRSALAAQLYGMGRFALSMQFYAKLMCGGRVSIRSQQKFLKNIINICKDYQPAALAAIDRMTESYDDGSMSAIAPLTYECFEGERHVEISNIGFPDVQDSSMRVFIDSAGVSCVSMGRSDSLLSIEDSKFSDHGDESVWQEMINCAEAEIRSSATVSTSSIDQNLSESSCHDDGDAATPVSHSGDEWLDKVITEIDKEEREVEYRERQKRKGSDRNPEVRAVSEPMAVEFSVKNPLGLDIELYDVQLVASLSCPSSGLMHTNAFSVSKKSVSPDPHANVIWSFHGSDNQFLSPRFLCQLPIKPNDSSAASFPSVVDEASEPYFVVTLSNLKMKPYSDNLVSLKICPLVEGDLRILGVRFHLLGEVWIYHRFDLPGPLLQDTRVNRSKRVRAESVLLRSKIENKMPSLKITISPNKSAPSTVLQGQTSCWNLKLANVGYAPAKNIILKTNAPWLNISASTSETSDEDAPTSFCIGPSGTLIRIPLLNTIQSDVLLPGESIEMPVAIRTSGGGRQDFYMLFRYELWGEENSPSGSVSCHRWARKLLSIPVYPSITMSASLMPSYSSNGEHILSVELMNYRSDRDTKLHIYLDKICIASRHFEIRQLKGQVDSNDFSKSLYELSDCDPVSSLQIGWQERITVHYLVVPIDVANTPVSISAISFSIDNQTISTSVPQLLDHRTGGKLADFMCRERAHELFLSTLQHHRVEKERILAEQEKKGQPRHVAQIRRAKTSLPEDDFSTPPSAEYQVTNIHPTSIASLCPRNGGSNINIICCWSAIVSNEEEDSVIFGQHHLRNLLVRPQHTSKGCPLVLTATYKPTVSHNFDTGPLVEDMSIIIRNRLLETNVEFEFAVDHQPFVDFSGTTCFNWSLSGGGEITVPLKVHVYAGGVYNLQSVRLTVIKSGVSVPYLFPLQWTMVAEDSALSLSQISHSRDV